VLVPYQNFLQSEMTMYQEQRSQARLERPTSSIAQDYYGRTSLHLAALFGHQDVITELLDYRVDSAANSINPIFDHLYLHHQSGLRVILTIKTLS